MELLHEILSNTAPRIILPSLLAVHIFFVTGMISDSLRLSL